MQRHDEYNHLEHGVGGLDFSILGIETYICNGSGGHIKSVSEKA